MKRRTFFKTVTAIVAAAWLPKPLLPQQAPDETLYMRRSPPAIGDYPLDSEGYFVRDIVWDGKELIKIVP